MPFMVQLIGLGLVALGAWLERQGKDARLEEERRWRFETARRVEFLEFLLDEREKARVVAEVKAAKDDGTKIRERPPI